MPARCERMWRIVMRCLPWRANSGMNSQTGSSRCSSRSSSSLWITIAVIAFDAEKMLKGVCGRAGDAGGIGRRPAARCPPRGRSPGSARSRRGGGCRAGAPGARRSGRGRARPPRCARWPRARGPTASGGVSGARLVTASRSSGIRQRASRASGIRAIQASGSKRRMPQPLRCDVAARAERSAARARRRAPARGRRARRIRAPRPRRARGRPAACRSARPRRRCARCRRAVLRSHRLRDPLDRLAHERDPALADARRARAGLDQAVELDRAAGARQRAGRAAPPRAPLVQARDVVGEARDGLREIVLAAAGGDDRVEEAAQHPLHHRRDEVLAVLEVHVEGAAREASARADRVEARLVAGPFRRARRSRPGSGPRGSRACRPGGCSRGSTIMLDIPIRMCESKSTYALVCKACAGARPAQLEDP